MEGKVTTPQNRNDMFVLTFWLQYYALILPQDAAFLD